MKIAHRALALLPCFALVAGEVGAQVYPAKPVRMVVGFAPGSGTDVVARLVTQKMPEILGQPKDAALRVADIQMNGRIVKAANMKPNESLEEAS